MKVGGQNNVVYQSKKVGSYGRGRLPLSWEEKVEEYVRDREIRGGSEECEGSENGMK